MFNGYVLVSVILLFVSLFYGKIVSFWFCFLVVVGLLDVIVLVIERRRVFVVFIFFWVYKLLVRKDFLDLLGGMVGFI